MACSAADRRLPAIIITAAVILGLCEGPITGGDCAVWTGTSISDLDYAGYSQPHCRRYAAGDLATELRRQTNSRIQDLPSVATWQIQTSAFSSATLPYLSFEIKGRLYGRAPMGSMPIRRRLFRIFLTNAQYGVGFPGGSIDATTLFGSSGDSALSILLCRNGPLPIAGRERSGIGILLARIGLQLTNTAAIWSDGLLNSSPTATRQSPGRCIGRAAAGSVSRFLATILIIVMRPRPKVASGTCTFNPDLTPVYNLTDDDYIYTDSEDPVQVSRVDPYSAYNMQRLEICQRSNYYDATPITVFDQNAIELYGLRIAATLTAHEICDAGVAQTAAQLILQRGLPYCNQYTFKLSWEYCLLEPMDLVTLTGANLGLENVAARITEVEEDAAGILTVTAEEFPGGTATAVAYAVQTKSSSGIGSNGSAGIVNTPLIFEPPTALTGGATQIWLGASGGLPPVEKLEEASSTGVHQCTMTLAAAQAAGTEVNFSLYVQADERSALLLGIFDGAVTRACAFDLAAQTATPGDNAVTASISAVSNWFAVSMTVAMAARAIPILTIGLPNSLRHVCLFRGERRRPLSLGRGFRRGRGGGEHVAGIPERHRCDPGANKPDDACRRGRLGQSQLGRL